MPKFQPGDRVRVVSLRDYDRRDGMVVGDIGRVLELSCCPWVAWQRDALNNSAFDRQRCRLMDEDQLERIHPQEGTMKIRHKKTREVVEGVEETLDALKVIGWYWQKNLPNGVKHLYRLVDWEQVPTETWVDVTGECEINQDGNIMHKGEYAMPTWDYRRTLVDCCGVKRIMVEKRVEG